MDEKILRLAIQEFFKEYVSIQKRVAVLVMELKKKAPVPTEDYERALEILNEEVEKTGDLEPHVKVLLRYLISKKLQWIEKAPNAPNIKYVA